MIAKLFAHVANERLEDFLFRIEIGVEAAERRAGAAGDGADRRFVKTMLAEFDRSGIEQFAQGTPPALGARRLAASAGAGIVCRAVRSEEHTSELQSLMRISYAVFCLKKK